MAQLLLLVLCVKKAFCVKYNSFSRLYCSFGLCMGLEHFVAKQQKKQEVNTMRHGVHLLLVCN